MMIAVTAARACLIGIASCTIDGRSWNSLTPLRSFAVHVGPGELQLITGKTLHFLNSSYSHIDLHRRREGTLFIELHHDDAAARGLSHGELVRVANGQGALLAECRVSRRVRPGVVWMPFGGFGDAAGNACSVNTLTPEEPTDWGSGSGFYDAIVEISPIRA